MYDFLDSPVSRLEPGAHFFLWAARNWVGAAASGRCVCRPIESAFRAQDLETAIDDFHLAMRSIFHNALSRLYFGNLSRANVTEHEALLLSGLRHAADGAAAAKPASRAMVHADLAPVLARALAGVAGVLVGKGQSLGITEPPSAPARLNARIAAALARQARLSGSPGSPPAPEAGDV